MVTMTALLLSSFFKGFPARLSPPDLRAVLFPLAGFLVWCGLSLIQAYSLNSIQGYLLLVAQVCAALLTVLIICNDIRRIFLVRAALIAAFISSSIGIAQYFGLNYEHGIEWVWGRSLEKLDIYSTSGNPNFLAAYLIGLLPLALLGSLGRLDEVKGWRWFYGIAAAAMTLCLIYTRTKGAWIGACLAVAYLLWLYRANAHSYLKQGRIIAVSVAAVIVLISGLYLSGSIEWIITELQSLQAGNVTIRGRLFLWQVTLSMIADHPLTGIGWGSYRAWFQEYQGRFMDTHPDYVSLLTTQGSAESSHNEYLEIAAETGLIGLSLFLLVIFFAFRQVNRVKRREDARRQAVVYASAAGVLAILVHSMFVFPLHLVDAGMIFWMLIGLIHAAAMPDVDYSAKRLPAPGSRSKAMKVGVSLAAASLAGLLIFAAFRPVMASIYHKEAWAAMAGGNFFDAIRLAEGGMKWSSLNDELYLLSGAAKYQLGMYRASIDDYNKAYLIYPDYMILFNVGLSYKRMGMLNEAADSFKRAVYVRPNLKEAYGELLDILRSTGNKVEEESVMARMRKMGIL